MARYLFTVWPLPGDVNPRIAVADALRARGHEVAFYTGARVAGTLADLGITRFPIQHVDEEALYQRHRLFQNDDGVGRASSPAEWRRMRAALRDVLIDSIPGQLADLAPVFDTWRPDAIVCDPGMLAPLLVLHEARPVPTAMLCLSAGCMLAGPDAPGPWGRGLPPPTTWRRRLRSRLESAVAHRLTREFRDAASALRARYGLAPLTMPIIDFPRTLPLYLVASVPELDYNRRDLPPQVHYVGRLSWERPSGQLPPAWIDQLPADRPLVYVTEGTVHGSQPTLLQAAGHGLADLPLQVLMTLTPDRDPAVAGLTALAPNVRLETQTPGQGWQSDILPRASLVITNGGAGSVLAALAAGVPLIVVPTSWDKPENAQRVVEAGAGLRLSAHRCTPQRLRAAVQRVLGEPAFRANARRLAAALGRYDGAARAAALLEGLCTERQSLAPAQVAARQA